MARQYHGDKMRMAHESVRLLLANIDPAARIGVFEHRKGEYLVQVRVHGKDVERQFKSAAETAAALNGMRLLLSTGVGMGL